MPDAFFASTAKKRQRTSQKGSASSNKAARTSKPRGTASKRPAQPRKAARRDEELESDATHSGVDDVDLRASDVDPAESDGAEDARETPAEKRLRLAKVYLQSVKEGLTLGECVPENRAHCAHAGVSHAGEGEFDAAEIDRDIISARLKEDVVCPPHEPIHAPTPERFSSTAQGSYTCLLRHRWGTLVRRQRMR